MRKSYSFRCVFFVLILSAFSLIVFSLKDSVYSTTDTEGIALENNPYGIAINPNTDIAVVSNEKSDSVSIVNLNTQTVLSTISVGKKPRGVAIDRGLNLAVIGNSHDNTISVIDLNTNKVTATIPVGKEPQGIAINQSTHRAYVTNHKDDAVSVIDLFSRENLGIIPVGNEPKDIAIDSELNLALVVNEKDYNLSVIDLKTYQITATVPVGQKPQAIDINPETHLAAVVNEKDNSITVINLLNWQTTTIPVGKHPIDIAINPLDNRALVICDEDRSLLLIDLDTNTILKNYALNKLPKGVAVNNFTNIAAVVNDKTDSLTLIQLPNPVSEITSLTPASAQRGSNGIILTIEGNKFITTSVAYFNSQAITTAFTDNHHIRITIPMEMLANAGVFPVTVVNLSPEGGTSNIANLQINNPVPSISMIDPQETMAGTLGLTLTIYGSGFFNDTTFYINGIQRPFTLVSQTKIQTELTAGELERGAYLEVTASNPPPGGGLSNKATFTVLNPVPSLSSINPTSVTAESPDFKLTLTGSNFVKTSIVSFNNQQFPSTYISSTQIEAEIPSGSIQTAGQYPVSVNNPSPGGGVSGTLNLTVTPKSVVEPLPEGSFGKQYEDLTPQNATIKSYDPKRFSIITGLVKNKTQNPLSGVKVSIHNHSEYGTALTDAQGRFSIPVDGDGTITIVYEKSGFITTHRQVYVPWNDIATTETIAMIPEDTISTTIAFDGNPSTIIAHKSSTITDESGSRSLTMVFSGDNKAYSKSADGTEVLLSSITTRATEFETPESMPAKLPPNSAYTYASELSVDSAKNVRFEKPVVVYVDNFLGFKVGEKVPVGYYDRDRAVWVPSDNGVVVKLLDTNGDGIVDALDSTGDGQPDDLNGNGSFTDEVAGLNDPNRYNPNSTYWRVKINHFTPWDCNWPYGPPSDAVSPNSEGNPTSDQQQRCDDKKKTNSYCESRSRIFHENIPIPGTDMTLHYASNRVKGYKSAITIPASGATVPSSLKSIIVKMELAGKTFETTLPPLPNQKAEFVWDGLDYLGKPVGSRTANISIGFVYQAVYYSAGGVAQAFAQAGTDVTGIRGREEIISWKRSTLIVQRGEKNTAISTIADGWTLSAHHYLNPSDANTLYKGDGTQSKNNFTKIITSAVIYEGTIFGAYGITVDNAGSIYAADPQNHLIWKTEWSSWWPETVAGGRSGFSGDGGPATEAGLYYPYVVAVDSTGNIYIADYSNQRIRKVDTSGIITTVAGNGQLGFSGDGGPATQAMLNGPYGLAVDNAGNIYIVDYYNYRIRKVDTGGIITTVAGNGQRGFSGDGGPAIQAKLNNPHSVEVDSLGNIYIADYGNNRIRKIDTSGIITTVAGNGQQGFSGDGTLATQAKLGYPTDIAVDSVGNIYFIDNTNNRIRKVDTSGIITTVAGNGKSYGNIEGVPATEASLSGITGIAVDTLGNIYLADSYYNKRIWKVSYLSAFAGSTIAGDTVFSDENGLGYILDSTGLHKSTIDLATGKTLLTFGYNQDKQLISITDRFGNQTTIQRDGSGISTSITSPDGIVTSLTIDSTNNLTKVTYPDNSAYSFTYTTGSLMTDEYDPKNNHFVHQYDANGRVTDIFDPEGGSWSYSRTVDNAGNILVSVLTGEANLTTYKDNTDSTGAYSSIKTDPTGAITTVTRSSDGLTETEQLCGMKQSLKYDLDSEYKFKYIKESTKTSPAGIAQTTTMTKTYQDTDADKKPDLITETTTLNSKSWTMSNNVLTGIITNKSPLNRIITTQYDISNLLTKQVTVTGLSPLNYTYDARGRLTGTTTGSRTTAIAYDPNGNIDKLITPDNKTFDYTYDVMGRLKSELRPDGTVVQYDYDSNGNMTVLTNPKSINNTFDYTANDQRKKWATPMSGSYLYSYDKERKLKTITFPSGKLITNTYTNGLLTSTSTPEGVTTFEYGCSSLLSSAIRGTEKVAYAYDGSLLKTDTRSGLLNQSISYAYNNDFKLSSMVYAGATQTLAYDNDGLLTTAGAFTITRNSQNGLPVSVSDGTLTNTRTFSGYGELDNNTYTIGGVNKYTWGLTRNLAGRITQRVENIDGATITWDYSYDNLGRLIEVKKNGTIVENYSYDGNGNRLSDNSRSYSYSTEDHVITAGTDAYQFDVDGFLTQKTTASGTTTYSYSSRGELLSVTKSDGTVVTYDHDALGRRIAKKINGIVVEKYLWQGMTRLLAMYDGNNNLIMRFNYADGRMPVSMTYGGMTYYLAYDQVGSLRAVTDSSGNIVKRIDYDSFGNILYDSNPTFAVPFGFVGGLHDKDTGLVRFGLRDYDSTIGRWTAKDPIDFAGGDVNLFNYVGNNPVNWIDPLGLISLSDLKPTDPGKVIAGITLQFAGYFLMGTAGLITYVEGPIALVDLGVGGIATIGLGSWVKGTQLIYQGYSELPSEKPCKGNK
ncbi:MAG: RHS repeat-associated core domain-containing protein [Thermodesulfovibrionales bacterium]|nr:RHS repeat-associated core domain-containing protein [Thermodesulfovibrionales bacterium]